mmetsp:Transcript_7954/g.13202  ORF Transcript_7954/g.13202 Transcript_7954/m.13202 type:complete len:507 (-) Transcript_7954:231-1751(-)|eukprot:CAMPEP_0174963602 /NCGR_PEP_ID=MMETSP0004_2-20121128/5419_1 /TAXON_ID=420556 /ORGANISM="Ochromonas sp., Strain CCMP1393" /LENGTH=506 /DNA_ID=CAMNT_0016212241 /DNA_START=72 /DNA_END=1595 /DNA_ORIENTATION=-
MLSFCVKCSILLAIWITSFAEVNLPRTNAVQLSSFGEIDDDPVPYTAGEIVDGISTANGLSIDCNNKFCKMMEYAVSCKAIGLDQKKICARYILGYKFACPVFPVPQDVVDAPSVCIPDLLAIAPIIIQGAAGLQQLIGPYLNTSDFDTTTCGRRCYQNYQYASHDFYYSCRQELNATKAPIATALLNYQEFRNQACSLDPATGANCYASITSLTDGSVPVDIFDFTCNYLGVPAQNNFVMGQVCSKLAPFGCCAATGISMLFQNQIGGLAAAGSGGSVDPKFFPPCLLQYLKDSCPQVALTEFCTNGSIATTSTVLGSVVIPRVDSQAPGVYEFPNVYNKTSVLTLMGIISQVLVTYGFGGSPYNFVKDTPFQVQITDYIYYNGTVALTPTGGQMYSSPYGGDYDAATSGNFTFQLVMQDVNASTAQALYALLANPQFAQTVGYVYTGQSPNAATGQVDSFPYFFDANPLDVGTAAFGASHAPWLVTLGITALATLLLFSSGRKY